VNVNKNVTVNKNFKFQKKQFNLQTNQINTKYKKVNFNGNYKIAGANKWKGPKYQVFVNYSPAWHDTWWWNWHHPHVVFVFGGWYYWTILTGTRRGVMLPTRSIIMTGRFTAQIPRKTRARS